MGAVLPLAQALEMLGESTAALVASAGALTDGQARGPSFRRCSPGLGRRGRVATAAESLDHLTAS